MSTSACLVKNQASTNAGQKKDRSFNCLTWVTKCKKKLSRNEIAAWSFNNTIIYMLKQRSFKQSIDDQLDQGNQYDIYGNEYETYGNPFDEYGEQQIETITKKVGSSRTYNSVYEPNGYDPNREYRPDMYGGQQNPNVTRNANNLVRFST